MSDTTRTDYAALKAQIEQWLTDHQVTAKVQFIGDDCPTFCTDKGKDGIGTFPRKTHIHGRHYRLTLTRSCRNAATNATWTVGPVVMDYWNSYHDAELECSKFGPSQYVGRAMALAADRKKAKVRVADVLGCAEWNDPGTFEEFCSEFGYDEDSRKAERIWQAVREQARDLARMFSAEEREAVQELTREL